MARLINNWKIDYVSKVIKQINESKKEPEKSNSSKTPNILKPPQLLKPNIVTEDMTSFSSHNKRNRPEDEQEGSAKSKKTFSQKEKQKRDIGQSSRGKSFVEEEKRILRENGVS